MHLGEVTAAVIETDDDESKVKFSNSSFIGKMFFHFSNSTFIKPLRILAIKTARDLKALSIGRIREDADAVLCSYRLLYPPFYRRRFLELSGNHAERQPCCDGITA
jgi:hypothetical protein